ncbi:hypothetical protein B0H14DRAFT_2606269 [Mycena olivaceomarginata]|nr:hypothetical protein B0H14DRAFT_2606269 [Mycena olivaceomarginata]
MSAQTPPTLSPSGTPVVSVTSVCSITLSCSGSITSGSSTLGSYSAPPLTLACIPLLVSAPCTELKVVLTATKGTATSKAKGMPAAVPALPTSPLFAGSRGQGSAG